MMMIMVYHCHKTSECPILFNTKYAKFCKLLLLHRFLAVFDEIFISSCMFIYFLCVFVFFQEINETAESANGPYISVPSDTEDMFVDTSGLDFDQV
jgi:hypothetical protein